jgi:hypothetical protein
MPKLMFIVATLFYNCKKFKQVFAQDKAMVKLITHPVI